MSWWGGEMWDEGEGISKVVVQRNVRGDVWIAVNGRQGGGLYGPAPVFFELMRHVAGVLARAPAGVLHDVHRPPHD